MRKFRLKPKLRAVNPVKRYSSFTSQDEYNCFNDTLKSCGSVNVGLDFEARRMLQEISKV